MNVIPFKFDSWTLRTVLDDAGEPWFVASDVCSALGLGNVSLAVNGRADRDESPLDPDEKSLQVVNTLGGDQKMLAISESGLYSLIFNSRKAEAKRFRKWIAREVLPSIRKTGAYAIGNSKIDAYMLDKDEKEQVLLLGKVAAAFFNEVNDLFTVVYDQQIQVGARAAIASKYALAIANERLKELEKTRKNMLSTQDIRDKTDAKAIAAVQKNLMQRLDNESLTLEEFLDKRALAERVILRKQSALMLA